MLSAGSYNVVTQVYTSFCQMFLLERFGVTTPKPIEFSATVVGEVVTTDGSWRAKTTNMYRAPALWWVGVKQSANNLCQSKRQGGEFQFSVILIYSSRNVKGSAVWGREQKDQLNASRGYSYKGPDLAGNWARTLLLSKLEFRESVGFTSPSRYWGNSASTRAETRPLGSWPPWVL